MLTPTHPGTMPKRGPSTAVSGEIATVKRRRNLQSSLTTLVLAFAMHRGSPTDGPRVDQLEKDENAFVVTVSEKEAESDDKHICANFLTGRGIKPVAAYIREHGAGYSRVLVVIDFWWLETGYYHARYGTDWLADNGKHLAEKGKCYSLLQAGAAEVLLPFSGGRRNKDAGEVEDMLENFNAVPSNPGKLRVERVPSLLDNPLWAASANQDLAAIYIQHNRGSNLHQTECYLHPDAPFVRVTKGPEF